MQFINNIEFTDREYEIISCLINGKTAKNIGIILKISPNTVNVHIRNIAFKIQRNNKNDIITFAESSPEYELLRKRYGELTGCSIPCDILQKKTRNFFVNIHGHLPIKIILILICVIFFGYIFVLFITESDKYIVKSIQLNIGESQLLYRENIENEIEKAFLYGRTVVLLGAGGSGKTTVARYYMLRKDLPIMFQVNCENATTVWQSMSELANLLAISEKDMNTVTFIKNLENEVVRRKKLIQFISYKLRKANKWGLLFDNVSNFDEISECFPWDCKIWGQGYVIITTRNANIANNSIFRLENIVKIGELSHKEKQELFYKITKNRYSKEELNGIPSMPLDICIAAHYMCESKTRLEKYIDDLHNKNNELFTREIMKNSIGYDKTRYSIVTTSFDEIIKQNQFYKELLLMICLLNSQNISEKYLLKYSDKSTVDKFLFLLKKYSLIDLTEDKITIHRATQCIGVKYLCGLLSEKEKTEVINKIVQTMTPYSELMWYLYDNQQQMQHKEIQDLIPHLETLKANIEDLDLSDKESQITRILLTMLYAYTPNSPRSEVRKLAKTILDRNKSYVVGYDLASLIIHYAYCGLPELQSEDKALLKKCVEICEQLHVYNLQAFAEVYLATFYCQHNDFGRCRCHLSRALDIAKTKKLRLMINYRYCLLYLDMRVSKEEMKKVISYTLDTLKLFKANEFFYLNKEEPYTFEGMTAYCIAALRKILIPLYNVIGDYEMAEKNYKEAKFFYSKIREKTDDDTIKCEGYINIEYAYTLLRKNKLNEANDLLKKSIDDLVQRNYPVYNALVYKSEIDVRLKRWEEAANDIKAAELYQLNTNSRKQKLLDLMLLFHKSIAEFHFGETEKFEKDVSDFYLIFNTFFKQNGAEFPDLSQIRPQEPKDKELFKRYLNYSYRSFSQIFGENHSFVKDYVLPLLMARIKHQKK